MKKYFTSDMKEYNRNLEEEFVSEEWGDRRQEVVFIGTGISEEDISGALDACLLSSSDMDKYQKDARNYETLMMNMRAMDG